MAVQGNLQCPVMHAAWAVVQDKLQSWSEPFREAFAGHTGVHWFEISLVESLVRRHA